MATRSWQSIKVRYCEHVEKDVDLEAHLVYPSDQLPDQPAHVMSHRCSEAVQCMLMNKPSCVWAGSNPAFDPFSEKDK
jgi:hypothetical protein